MSQALPYPAWSKKGSPRSRPQRRGALTETKGPVVPRHRPGGRWQMASVLLLTNALQPSAEVLPALGLLLHSVRVAPAEASALLDAPPCDVLLLDGRRDLPHARATCRLLRTTRLALPLLLVVTEGALTAVTAEWGVDDVVLDTAGPAEVEA